MDAVTDGIEQQLTMLFRRANRVHLLTQDGDVSLERSAYGIMCKLVDEGPQRLGTLACAFGLDPSTITRQVQDLERVGLASREKDPTDGRAFIVDLTSHGRAVLERTRDHRRARLGKALADWAEDDVSDMARLLRQLNLSINRLEAHLLVVVGGLLEYAV